MTDVRFDDLREYIEHLRQQGYSVRDGHTPDPDLIDPEGNPVYTWQEGYPYPERMTRDEYELEKYLLQVELLKFQYWLEDTGNKAIIVFEGRDAAGKGGTIKRFTEHLNPRSSRVVALTKPSDREQGQWYFQRYIIQALRGWTSAPIIVVSGRTGSADKVEALDAGADDYVTKPFQIDELLARLRALGRRASSGANDPVVAFGDVEVDLAAKAARRAGTRVHLTPTEWRMLEFLARNPGTLVTRQTLLKEIWGTEQVADTGYLRLYMSQLRKKLEADPARPVHLLTEQGMGYRLVVGR